MLLYLLIVLLFLLFYKEGFKQKKNTSCEARHKAISDYPEKHIDILFNAKFKPECCPSPYSNSGGCLCRDINHSELIVMRGGNRIMC